MPRSFLTAVWSDLLLITYAVDPSIVAACLPDGLEPDTRDGMAYASLVAFDFRETRVLGTQWPGLTRFPEINLRVYARLASDGRRGVVFIRELVPRRLIVWVARLIYNEPYAHAQMRSCVDQTGDMLSVEHTWTRAGTSCRVRAETSATPTTPPNDSFAHFIKEHRWGFGRDRRGRTLVYEVEHPAWQTRRVDRLVCEVDYAALYGDRWGLLTGCEPTSTLIALGSRVEVFGCEAIGVGR